jgi:hypothetical protein
MIYSIPNKYLKKMKEESDFLWLLKWYHKQCDGDWEHGSGVHINTINNPGWSISINLDDTELSVLEFQEIRINYTEKSWLLCRVEEFKFKAYCGPSNLPEVLKIFREWAEGQKE